MYFQVLSTNVARQGRMLNDQLVINQQLRDQNEVPKHIPYVACFTDSLYFRVSRSYKEILEYDTISCIAIQIF